MTNSIFRGFAGFILAIAFSISASAVSAKPTEQKVSWIHPEGQIIIKVNERKLYYVHKRGRAYVYPIATPKHRKDLILGRTEITMKRPKPRWTPTASMREKNPNLPDFVPGGPGNPLGVYALNLGFPAIRIHGNNNPRSIGTAASAGCYRMYNKDVLHLAELVEVGTNVIVRR